MAVMPSGRVLKKLAWSISNGPQKRRPIQQLRVADFVQLFNGQRQQRILVACLELRNEPAIEFEIRMRIFPGSGIVRRSSACQYGDAFRPGLDRSSDFRA